VLEYGAKVPAKQKRPSEGDRFDQRLNLSAEHVANLTLDRIFSHELKLRVGLLLPHRDFCKGNGDGALAERIFSRLVDVV
jgi:hypothetical protein